MEDIKDVESKIIELEAQKKEKKTPHERGQITGSIKKLQEEYRILTQQQEDLKNITIYIRKQGEMRYSMIVDPIQTRIMSQNLFDGKTLVIKGGPGTGKTTTMIHRLAYLTDTFAINEDEKNKLNNYKITSSQRKQLLDAIKENRDWMFFSPSQMLKEYLAEAMKKEGLTNTSEKVWDWKDYCQMILKEYYHLLESRDNNAPFRDILLVLIGSFEISLHLKLFFFKIESFILEFLNDESLLSSCFSEIESKDNILFLFFLFILFLFLKNNIIIYFYHFYIYNY